MESRTVNALMAMTNAFDTLEGVESRREAIKVFLERLSHHEMRELNGMLDTDFRFDIIAQLPLELVSRVFQYLDLRMAVRYRRVSKRWTMVLSSRHLLYTLVQDWYGTKDLGPSATMQSVSSVAELTLLAEHVDAFCSARPFSAEVIDGNVLAMKDNDSFQRENYPGAVCLGRVAWYNRKKSQVKLYDARSRRTLTWQRDRGEYIVDIALSHSLLAFCNMSSKIYVHNYLTGSEHDFQLSSARARKVAVTGKTVAILQSTPDELSFCITVWTANSRPTHHFNIATHNLPSEVNSHGVPRLVVHPNETELVYFELVVTMAGDGRQNECRYTRMTTDGNFVATGCLQDDLAHFELSTSMLPYPSNRHGDYTVWSGWLKNKSLAVRVAYNIYDDRFSVQRISYPWSTDHNEHYHVGHFTFWNNIVFAHPPKYLDSDVYTLHAKDWRTGFDDDWIANSIKISPFRATTDGAAYNEGHRETCLGDREAMEYPVRHEDYQMLVMPHCVIVLSFVKNDSQRSSTVRPELPPR